MFGSGNELSLSVPGLVLFQLLQRPSPRVWGLSWGPCPAARPGCVCPPCPGHTRGWQCCVTRGCPCHPCHLCVPSSLLWARPHGSGTPLVMILSPVICSLLFLTQYQYCEGQKVAAFPWNLGQWWPGQCWEWLDPKV